MFFMVGTALTLPGRAQAFFSVEGVAKLANTGLLARIMANRSRRGLLPAVLALAGVMPFGAEAFEPHRGNTAAFEPQRGTAAVYDANRFTGRPMANGTRFHPELPVAAHRHLPLGTRAEVTNLRTGQTTTVTITDRGPFTPGRILDLSPRSAREIGMNGGLAQVEVRPLGQFASR
jgi:rare lipoprotein A